MPEPVHNACRESRSSVLFDFETWSNVDLSSAGSRRYAADPSTAVTCAVFLIGGVYHVWVNSALPHLRPGNYTADAVRPVRFDAPIEVHITPGLPDVVAGEARAGSTFVAHNCEGFDRRVWERHLDPVPTSWADTYPLALRCGLPGGIDKIGESLLGRGKDRAGRKALKMFFEPVDSIAPGYFTLVLQYAIIDVAILAALWGRVKDAPMEPDVLAAHYAVNARGVPFDRDLAARLLGLFEESADRASARIERATDGRIQRADLNKRAVILAWLEEEGVRLPNLRRETVDRFIDSPGAFLGDEGDDAPVGVSPHVARVLADRNSALRITPKKLTKAHTAADADGRLRDLFVYHGAHTGRWTGRTVQLQNLPKPPKGVDVEALLALHAADDLDIARTEAAAKRASVNPDDVLTALMRPCVSAPEGRTLVAADFAAVECRGVAWMAGDEAALGVFRAGGDPYLRVASVIYGREIAKGDHERQVGKIVELGCGYGMGHRKFALMAAMFGIDLREAGTSAEKCVAAYRDLHPEIKGLWRDLDLAAKRAARGGVSESGRCRFSCRDGMLVAELPSGRELWYRGARVEVRPYAFDPSRAGPQLVYDSPHGERTLYGGKLAENLCQAICRDLLADALVRAEAAGLNPVAHVHDEIVCEVPEADGDAACAELCRIMATAPAWAEGFPVAVEGFASKRYLKSPPKGVTVHSATNS